MTTGRKGFTLIEMSIVLIIIGLVAGGVLLGRDLMRASELRKIHRQLEEFVAAANTFRAKYHCLPGDCGSATAFFGKHSDCPDLSTLAAGEIGYFYNDVPSTLTCDGNNDGGIDSNNTFYEATTFWQQLASAGLIGGLYSGGWKTIGQEAWVGGFNTPTVHSSTSHWMVFESGPTSVLLTKIGIPPSIVPVDLGNVLYASAGTLNPQVKVFTPAEAAGYDIKWDDGNPVKGHIMVAFGSVHCTNAPQEVNAEAARTTNINAGAQYLAGDAEYQNQFTCALLHRADF